MNRIHRSGAATVEFALVLPAFFLLVFSTIELTNMTMVRSVLINETREAARIAINSNSDEATIRQVATESTSRLLVVPQNVVTVTVSCTRDGQSLESFANAIKGDYVTVEISVPYSEASLLAGRFASNVVSGSCTMEKE